MTEKKYGLDFEGNKVIINDELELSLWIDTPDKEAIEPDEVEWVDEGAYYVYNDEENAGVTLLAIDNSNNHD